MTKATHAEKERGTKVPPKPILPHWVMDRSVPETPRSKASNDPETAGFASGSALALLHVVLNDPNINVPAELLRNRLALRAAAHCLKLEGRVQTQADIRDAYLLTAAGDAMGPAGGMLALWRGGSTIPLKHAGWQNRLRNLLPSEMQERWPDWLDHLNENLGNPVAHARLVLTTIVQDFPRHEAAALLCADTVLARGLGWDRPLPLLGLHLNRKVFRDIGDGATVQIACHNAGARAAQDAVRLTHDLARRAAQLRAVEPKLRTKGSQDAVRLFLSEDAVLPSTMLSPIIRGSSTAMTPRSARRLCERLIELGVVRELTGRATFRLYGVS